MVLKGKVQTVLGLVNPSDLGHVLPHEHLEQSLENVFFQAPLYSPELSTREITLTNLGWIRQFPYSHLSNMTVRGPEIKEALTKEMRQFKSCGGGTLVDNTCSNVKLSDHSAFAQKLSQDTGVHIVVGTGLYVRRSQSEGTLALSEEEVATQMREDITEGTRQDPSVKCGMVGEIGCSWPLEDCEKRSLQAASETQVMLGCPVMIHPGRSPAAPEEILRIYAEVGGNPCHVVMAHLDRTFLDIEEVLEFAKMGSFLEYDLFGIETSYYQLCDRIFMPSDGQRIQNIEALLSEGYEDRILISHDLHTKHRMERFGGHGYSHIQNNVIPMMLKRGISQESIDKITCHNPANWLTFRK